MSLSRILKTSEMRAQFRKLFQKPQFVLKTAIVAPVTGSNSQLVGTAYDYALRFMLEKKYHFISNPRWVAEEAPSLIYERSNRVIAYHILYKALTNHYLYTYAKAPIAPLLRSCLELAQLDFIFRSTDPNVLLGDVDPRDLKDLKNLVTSTDLRVFKAKKSGVLNPRFGHASNLVGGADADILVDDRLIEIKTTKDPQFKRDDFNQLVGYYLLSVIGGVSQSWDKVRIKQLAVYFSRSGQLISFSVSQIASSKELLKAANWFERTISK